MLKTIIITTALAASPLFAEEAKKGDSGFSLGGGKVKVDSEGVNYDKDKLKVKKGEGAELNHSKVKANKQGVNAGKVKLDKSGLNVNKTKIDKSGITHEKTKVDKSGITNDKTKIDKSGINTDKMKIDKSGVHTK